MAAITQINSVSISPLAGPCLSPCALDSFFCLFKFLFAFLKSSSSINICRGPIGPNVPLLHLLFTSAGMVVPPLFGLNPIIMCYFQHLPPAVLQAFSNPTCLFWPVVLPKGLIYPQLKSLDPIPWYWIPVLPLYSLYDLGGTFGVFLTYFPISQKWGICTCLYWR